MKGLSDANLKVIYIFVAILVAAGAYMFGISKNMDKRSELAEQNTQLEQRLEDLKRKNDQSEQVQAEIDAMNVEIEEICNRFPGRLTEQKVYYIVDDLMEKTGVEINSIAVSLNNMFYSNGIAPEYELGNNVADDGYIPADELPEGAVVEDTAAEEGTEEQADYNNLAAYETTVTVPFSGEYDEIKSMIDYITQHEDHMSVGTMSASFDTATGLVSGSLIINMYALSGNGKPYEEPQIEGIGTGVTNIFGSYSRNK